MKPALGATEEEVLEILKSKKYTQYVKVKEVLNKEQIAADFREGVLTLRELSKLGLTIEKYNEDDFQLNFAASVDNAVPQV